ncbi:DUF599 domain-containing protein [Desulfobulbus rhabdoformis]|uniref:DUF599 domain-containing protein n=1 Tax=Desulfobulbus rhabdoformis TaxID=34032 RepID=UPI00196613DA|nr:DUF599 domain-containing protein [Desulfobulbus rhabdoformis]MBM9613820.1 DUF599 domain-containing protein [Desulfobulbus rhabdoformis]
MMITSWHEFAFDCTSLLLLIAYHGWLFVKVRRKPLQTAIGITNHARHMWVQLVMQGKRDILAVQTMRNQVMSASFMASTAILLSLGALNSAFRSDMFSEITHTLNMYGARTEELWMFKLMLLGILFFLTFFNFSLAIRYYNHASYMINTGSSEDNACSVPAVTQVLNRGALHYTFGMRGFYLSAPLTLWLFGPEWMFTGFFCLIVVLYRLDGEA